jgi:hypothetical protein
LKRYHGDEYEASIAEFGLHRVKTGLAEEDNLNVNEPFTIPGFYSRFIVWWTVTSQVRIP